MKRGFIILISLVVLIAVILSVGYYKIKEKKSITGEATNSNFAVTIVLSSTFPNVSIVLPENETYITNKNLQLNYTSQGASSVWYNIDQTGGNITLTGNTIFNTTAGSHVLYIYANNTEGNITSDNVSFFVNQTLMTILYDKYFENGSSTNFNQSSYEDLQNLAGVILELDSYGKIDFGESINVTDDFDSGDMLVDITNNTDISFNKIDINSTALPNFNKSATLYLYNLGFSNPRVLRNSEVCPDAICIEVDYNQGTGTFIFNVTQFTNYSAEETPSESPGGGSSGGSGSVTITGPIFDVIPNQISINLRQGEVRTREIAITNNLNRPLKIKIETEKLGDFLLIKEQEFTLNSKEVKYLDLDFIIRKDVVPDLYIGKIIVSSEDEEEEILTVVEVESIGALLDVYLEIDQRSKRVFKGEEVLAQIKMFNLGERRTDVNIEYQIRDDEDNILLTTEETIAIEVQTSLIKNFGLPEEIKEGKYVLYIRATYNNEVASASDFFEVISTRTKTEEAIYTIIVILLAVILSFIIYYLIKRKITRMY